MAFDYNKCKEERLPTNCTQHLSRCLKGICVCDDESLEYPHQRCHKSLPHTPSKLLLGINIPKQFTFFSEVDECPILCNCNNVNGAGCDTDTEECIDGNCICKATGELVLPHNATKCPDSTTTTSTTISSSNLVCFAREVMTLVTITGGQFPNLYFSDYFESTTANTSEQRHCGSVFIYCTLYCCIPHFLLFAET